MLETIIGSDTRTIPLLLLFIVGLLTKRIVPWYVYEEVVNKLKKYEDAAPGIIEEVNRLIEALNQGDPTMKTSLKDSTIISSLLKKEM